MIARARKPYRKTQKECLQCGAPFVAGGQAKYCSRKCQLHGYKRPQNRKKRCEHCRKNYTTYDKTQRFCSVACRNQSKAKPVPRLTCKVCNKKVYRRERLGQTDTNEFCSRSCALKWRHAHAPPRLPRRLPVLSKPCKRCHLPFTPKNMSSPRCGPCKAEAEKRQYEESLRKRRELYQPAPKIEHQCIECGDSFYGGENRKYCSDRCCQRALKRTRKHRERSSLKTGDHITLHELIERDEKVCQLCGITVNLEADMIRDDEAPTIDHIIPLAKDGEHTWSNVQLACRRCNSIKSDSLDWSPPPGGGISPSLEVT